MFLIRCNLHSREKESESEREREEETDDFTECLSLQSTCFSVRLSPCVIYISSNVLFFLLLYDEVKRVKLRAPSIMCVLLREC